LGEEHPDTAISYNNFAALYYKKNKVKEAYVYAKKSVEIFSKVLPKGHPNLKSSKELLGVIEKKLKVNT